MAKKLTAAKAREILHDKEVHGHPLTDKQRKFFGAVASGRGWLDKYENGGFAQEGEQVRPQIVQQFEDYRTSPEGKDYFRMMEENRIAKKRSGRVEYSDIDPITDIALPLAGIAGTVGKQAIKQGVKNIGEAISTHSPIFMQTENSMTRGIGSGSLGYRDLLESGVVRANPRGRLSVPNQMAKNMKMLEANGFSTKEIEEVASNNLSESTFKKLKTLESAEPTKVPGTISLRRKTLLDNFEDYNQYKNQPLNPDYEQAFWYESGGMPNYSNYPGDYFVRLSNKQAYNPYVPPGHYHPTTESPVALSDPNLQIFRKRNIPIINKPIGVRVPKYKDGGLQEYQENYNQPSVSYPPNFVGMNNNTKGFDYNSAWGGRWENGGMIPGVNAFMYARHGAPSNGPRGKKTLASAEDGASMRYYQEGLDFQPKTISKDGSEIPKFQLGGMAFVPGDQQLQVAAQTLGMFGEALSAPQKAATYAVTGKYQTPSEAMNIQNPWGQFAVDATLDPVNFVGAGIAGKLLKNIQKGKQLKNIPKFISEVDWGNWNKEILENPKLLEEYSKIEELSKKSGNWMKYPDGSDFKGTPEQFVQEQSENFKKAFPQGYGITYRGDRKHFPELDYNPIFTGDKQMATEYTTSHGSFWRPFHEEGSVSKILDTESGGLHELYYKQRPNTINIDAKSGDWVDLNVPEISKSKVSTDDVASYIAGRDMNAIINNVYDGSTVKGTVRIIPHDYTGYLKSARGNNGMFDMTNPNIYKGVIPASIIGAAAQKQRDGGITKDNMGYWNPDNWGKPVEIDSNQITMQGVNQPLLGISDTGDAKIMKPGKDYRFKGKKVTEFPIAEEGASLQLDKLDQLTNFTNYNKPTRGGWLDKY